MRTFIANFGLANHLWPECFKRSAISTFEDEDLRPLWVAGDREGYIERCITTKKTTKGIAPTRPVASRWFNLAHIVSETEHDLWIHREKNELWWSTSLPEPAIVEKRADAQPDGAVRNIYLILKPAQPWSNADRAGRRLEWEALHPKAREFLFTEGTMQQLSKDNADYSRTLIDGEADRLARWHARDDWKAKAEKSRGGATTIFDARRRAVLRMVMTAYGTAAQSNGQEVSRIVKNKEVRFGAQLEFERYVDALIDAQEALCAITDLPLQYDGDVLDTEMLPSLDRIDSEGHYEPGNLQIVCRFVNRWKGAAPDHEFRRLMGIVQRRT